MNQRIRLLYIDYWGIEDALTISTVFPNLEILRPYCSKIYLATIERNGRIAGAAPQRVIHVPFYTIRWLPRVLQKLYDITFFSLKLLRLCSSKKIDLVICRGSLAAIFGFVLYRTKSLPYFVESFEPHSEYMVEGKTWSRQSIEFRFQRWIELRTPRSATRVMPVTHNYAKVLADRGIPSEKISVMPCCVNLQKFEFDATARRDVRLQLRIPDDVVVGIYVGKFGDIYLNEEAFDIFKQTLDFFSRSFFLIVLSPIDQDHITGNLQRVGFPIDKSFVSWVPHGHVPRYLSAADFAFSLVRPSAARKFCSPVKNGEYWANGLPILMPEGVGDDDAIIRQEGGGACYDTKEGSILQALSIIKVLLAEGRPFQAKKISRLARRHRNFEIIANSYQVVFTKWRPTGYIEITS